MNDPDPEPDWGKQAPARGLLIGCLIMVVGWATVFVIVRLWF